MSLTLPVTSCWQRAQSTSRHIPKPTGSVIVGRASSSELSDGMGCLLVGEEGSVEVGVSTEIEDKTDCNVCISYMLVWSVCTTCGILRGTNQHWQISFCSHGNPQSKLHTFLPHIMIQVSLSSQTLFSLCQKWAGQEHGKKRVQHRSLLIGFQPTNQILLPRSGQLLIIHQVSPLAICGRLQHWQTSYRPEVNVTDAIAISMAYQKRRKMFEVRGLIIIHEHREENWLTNIHEITLHVAVVNMLPFLELLR